MLNILTGSDIENPRSEVVLNINSITNLKAIKVGDFKYMLNPNDRMSDEFDNWFAAPGINPDTNETVVPDCKPAQIFCGPVPTAVNPSCFSNQTNRTECLFNIKNDPCEYYNLVDNPTYNKIKKDILQRLEKWESLQVLPQNPPVDPEGNPKLQNYNWQPWTDDPNLPTESANSGEKVSDFYLEIFQLRFATIN